MSEKMTRPLLFILLSCVLYIGVLCIQPKCFQEKSVDLLQGEFIWSHVAASGTGKLANHTDFNMNKTLKPYLV